MIGPKPPLAYDRAGAGPPLLLLHGLSDDRRAWTSLTPQLATAFDVIAVDLPGHGRSPRLSSSEPADPAALARQVAVLLDDLGLDRVHLVGNSLGGWVALELARTGRATTVTCLSPAGLWDRESARNRIMIHGGRSLARLGPLARAAVRTGLGRRLALGAVSAHPERLSEEDAMRGLEAIASTRGFHRIALAAHATRFTGGRAIGVPTTIAWGEQDRILTPPSPQRRSDLPVHTRWITLPDCGHCPMFDDPARCIDVIRDTATGHGVEDGAATGADADHRE